MFFSVVVGIVAIDASVDIMFLDVICVFASQVGVKCTSVRCRSQTSDDDGVMYPEGKAKGS